MSVWLQVVPRRTRTGSRRCSTCWTPSLCARARRSFARFAIDLPFFHTHTKIAYLLACLVSRLGLISRLAWRCTHITSMGTDTHTHAWMCGDINMPMHTHANAPDGRAEQFLAYPTCSCPDLSHKSPTPKTTETWYILCGMVRGCGAWLFAP